MRARVGEREVVVGTEALLTEEGIAVGEAADTANSPAAVLAVADEVSWELRRGSGWGRKNTRRRTRAAAVATRPMRRAGPAVPYTGREGHRDLRQRRTIITFKT